jgi:ABC-type branched-subunit amino acid transport system substrate-binding protein
MNTKLTVRHLPRSWRLLGVLLAALVIAVSAIPLAGASPAAQGGSVLRIGYLGPPGTETANGAQLAIDQINAIGGITAPDGTIYTLELVTLDAIPTVDTIGEAANTLVGEDATVILGPDDNAQITPDTIAALTATRRPILSAATGDAMTDVDQDNYLFRTRAPERVYSHAIATYLIDDLGISTVAAVQTEVEFTEALLDLETTMNNNGIQLADKVVLPGGEALGDEASRLLTANPQAVVMWGAHDDARTLLETLRGAGWDGIFAYRYADEAARAGILPDDLAARVLGFGAWSYGDETRASRIFLRDYVVAFGEMPDTHAVAAYDALWFLRGVARVQGVDPIALQSGLIGATPQTLVQGVLHPIEFINGDLARMAVVYELGKYGGPAVVAKFDDATRIDTGAAAPEPTPEPTVPVETPLPTATLEGTWIRVNVNVLNVRTGPGFNYEKIGEVQLDETYRVLGAAADYQWVVIDFQGGVGWVKTEFVDILGDLADVSVIQPPPSPTPAATATVTLPPNPDVLIDSVTLNPQSPIPGVPFTASITVRNAGGGAAGRFAVAATWLPGEVFTSTWVEGLAGGQSVQVQLTATLGGTGVHQVAVVADLNDDVAELNEDNNVFNVSYRADQQILVEQKSVQIPVDTGFNLDGGSNDFQWDGYNIAMRNGSQIGQLLGITYQAVHYDILAPALVAYDSVGFGVDKVLNGAIFAFITDQGNRAVIRVDNVQGGGNIIITFRVYNTP